jgi:prenyltransferase/squalene oxidase-like repeat protein
MIGRTAKALTEATGLVRGPHRVVPLIQRLAHDRIRVTFDRRHLYSYATTTRATTDALGLLIRWLLDAQRTDGGIAAYYSLLKGYSESYPEVTGYIIPTLFDFAHSTRDESASVAAERATQWLLSLQLPTGAFPAGLHGSGSDAQPSVFNTGQILHGLVRAWRETHRSDVQDAAIAAGDWLVAMQQADGSWSGPGAYQGTAHTYYSMVSWALAALADQSADNRDDDRDDDRYGLAAERNCDWVLSQVRPSGWVDGINLQGHPSYLHFIAYILQGVLECSILRRRNDAIQTIAKSAWVLLRKFETRKYLPGAFETDFKRDRKFTCVTGNAQMSCVWLRLFEVTHDLRYLNGALKMNEMLKQLIPRNGPRGIVGGVSGSYPVWGSYQPLRYISWGCKFFADALMLEQRVTRSYEAAACAP